MYVLKEDIWNLWKKGNNIICITTNGSIKHNGACVMGRGVALEAKQHISRLDFLVGEAIQQVGNIPIFFQTLGICTFPTKHNWWEQSDIELIKKSLEHLIGLCKQNPGHTWYLPKPGCSNGQLEWKEVRPIIEPLMIPEIVIVDKFECQEN